MPGIEITMGLHICKIPECTIFAEVIVGGRTFIFSEKELREFVKNFNEQVERVLPRPPRPYARR